MRTNSSDAQWRSVEDPPSLRADALRYALAALVVLAALAALVSLSERSSRTAAASDVDDAVMVDLPPAEVAPPPAGDTPAPQAQQTPSTQAPAEVSPTTPVDPPAPDAPPPPPLAPEPSAVLPKPATVPPPPPPPVVETAPTGSDAPVTPDPDPADAIAPHAAARLITIWQKALMRRLETAKRALDHTPHGAGSVTIAFAIDAGGRLVSERVARSSGSTTLDRAALALVDHAAPFPVPPSGAGASDLSFTVPVLFKR